MEKPTLGSLALLGFFLLGGAVVSLMARDLGIIGEPSGLVLISALILLVGGAIQVLNLIKR
jgi:hypothetical protein